MAVAADSAVAPARHTPEYCLERVVQTLHVPAGTAEAVLEKVGLALQQG